MYKKLLFMSLVPCFSFLISQSYGYITINGKILDSNGQPVIINGINWSGFQDSGFIDELYGSVPFYPLGTQENFGVMDMLTHPWDDPNPWSDPEKITADNSVAFQTIRLPINPTNLTNNQANSHFHYDLTDAKNPSQGNGVFCSTWDEQHCTAGLSVSDSLYQVIAEFKKNNVRVLVDFHQTHDGRDGNVTESDYSLDQYLDDVALLVKTLKNKNLDNVIGIDVFNEPHNLDWFQAKNSQVSWIQVIASVATVVHENNPDLLLFVEGPDSDDPENPTICLPQSVSIPQDPDAYTIVPNSSACSDQGEESSNDNQVIFKSNFGENFKPLLDTTSAKNGQPILDVNNLRSKISEYATPEVTDWLLGKAGDDASPAHLVFSPHVYGKYVATWQSTPEASPYRFDWNWGFLINSRYPVVIGETGFLPNQTTDVDFFEQSLMPYLLKKQNGNNLFYWTWNTNSGDTGGVRADENSTQLVKIKEKDLHDLFSAIPPVKYYGKLCVTISSPTGYTGSAYPMITATGNGSYSFKVKSFDQSVCQDNIPTGTYALTGSVIQSGDGLSYELDPSKPYSATVVKNKETDTTLTYVAEPSGILQVNVTGTGQCVVPQAQPVTVTYAKDSISKTLVATSTQSGSVKTSIGSYAISVAPDALPNQPQCKAQYNPSVNVTENKTVIENVTYVEDKPGTCQVKVQCNTWGTASDSWAGSSCNLFIQTASPMSKPAVLTFAVNNVSNIQPWNATANLDQGNLSLTLQDPVYVPNAGFNVSGIISLPTQAKLITGEQTFSCDFTSK